MRTLTLDFGVQFNPQHGLFFILVPLVFFFLFSQSNLSREAATMSCEALKISHRATCNRTAMEVFCDNRKPWVQGNCCVVFLVKIPYSQSATSLSKSNQ